MVLDALNALGHCSGAVRPEDAFGRLLAALGPLLVRSWVALVPLLGARGLLLATLGRLLGPFWSLLGDSSPLLGRSWPLLGRSCNAKTGLKA